MNVWWILTIPATKNPQRRPKCLFRCPQNSHASPLESLKNTSKTRYSSHSSSLLWPRVRSKSNGRISHPTLGNDPSNYSLPNCTHRSWEQFGRENVGVYPTKFATFSVTSAWDLAWILGICLQTSDQLPSISFIFFSKILPAMSWSIIHVGISIHIQSQIFRWIFADAK